MSLRCCKTTCRDFELASGNQLAFYQDINNRGWNLGISPEYGMDLPSNDIVLVATGKDMFPYDVLCKRCNTKIGKVNEVCGFRKKSVNFSATKVFLLQTRDTPSITGFTAKWGKIISQFPLIQKLTATLPENPPLVGRNTVHFNGVSDFYEMLKPGKAVAARKHSPRRYQWRAYLFACLQNSLICLPTGMGKTLIANMLMKAYHHLNPDKAQIFIVPTIVLVNQQATDIENNTGLKIMRRSSEHNSREPWTSNEICVCTPAMLNQAISLKEIDMSQIGLLVFDEVHEANSPNSQYGLILPYITTCLPAHRPRVLSLTASPSGENTNNIRECIANLCRKLDSKPFSPLENDDKNTASANDVNYEYIEFNKTQFEASFEEFVFETLEKLSKLHPHLASAWTEVPTNVEVNLKVNAAERVFSHSGTVADHHKDNALFQLTLYMKKWVQSLDLLRVFGPDKLLEFIRSDLYHSQVDSTLTEIRDPVLEMIPGFHNKLLELESQNTIDGDSTRAARLLKKIKEHDGDNARIMIFVQRRITAGRLCRLLEDDPEIYKMNPKYVVGNSSGNSEITKEQQQEVLKKFRDGDCKVLVATSVLEQGIDVAACNVVICFDGVKSLKSIIQSRGRARKQSANFIVFVSTQEREKFNKLTLMERQMNCAILELMNAENSRLESELEKKLDNFLEDADNFVETGEADIDDIEDEDEDDLEDFEDQRDVINMRFFNYYDSDALIDLISSIFTSPNDRLKSTRKFVIAKFNLKDSIEARSEIFRRISAIADPKDLIYLSTWIQTSTLSEQKKVNAEPPTAFLTFKSLTGFFFKNCVTVCIENNFIWNGVIKVLIKDNEIVLQNGNEEFIITRFDVSGPILINETENSLAIFLCLSNPPKFFKRQERAPFNFHDRSFNLRLKVNGQIAPKAVWDFRKALEFFSLEVYNVANLREIVITHYQDRDMESFQHSYLLKTWQSKHSAVLPPKLEKHIYDNLKSVSTENLEIILENNIPERFQKLKFYDLKDTTPLPFSKMIIPSNYFMVGRIKVTPSRYKFMPMVATPKNRIFRYFPNPENFVIVSLTDEHEENPWQSQAVYDWFLEVLKTGIKIAGKVYKFLGCSNSQLREGHCWFSCLDRQEVYGRIGRLPPETNAGRKLTRLGLAFAASIETVELDYDRYLKDVEPDIEPNGICFSDGIGRGSRELFKTLTKALGLETQPSAFQIRVGGVKGVISVFDGLDGDVKFRKSMKKFESDHKMLEVLEYSKPIKLHLNRHIILLLSNYGVPDDVFLDLQFFELEKCMIALADQNDSMEFVKSSSKVISWESIPPNMLCHEPMFREILFSQAFDLFAKIVDRSHIFVEKGRVLMGVLDETGTLEYGEIYAHIIEKDFDKELEGEVVVFRNPAVLPSDVRRLNARTANLPENFKKLYRNCLVIPSRGQSCHAHECSGGDLDGDLYYVIWDEKLMPPKLPKIGVKVFDVKTKVTKEVTGNSDEDMMQFFCDYSSNFQLGIIANAHLAISDQLGMSDEQSIKLACYVTAETDAPKKGFTVGRPPKELLPKEYPDFMRKGDKVSYRSKTVLGKLFREANPLLEILIQTRTKTNLARKISLKGNVDSVETHYSLFSFEVKRMLQSFDLTYEADLFSGTPMWPDGYVSNYKQQNQLRQTVVDNARMFWKKWEKIFEEWRVKVGNDQTKILEWYNRPTCGKYPIHSFSFLAMPYVEFETIERHTMIDRMQHNAVRWFNSKKIAILGEFVKREKVGKAIMEKLQGIECHFYGSSMLGLSEEYSDIDLYAANRNFEGLETMLRELDKDATALKKPHECVSMSFDSCTVDITNFVGGVQKTYALAETFDENPGLWPALRILIEWARNAKIIKSGGSGGLMTVVSFCQLFVYYATSETPKTVSEQKPYDINRLEKWINSSRKSDCGKLIYGFLKMLSDRRHKNWITSRIDPFSDEVLIKSDLVNELRLAAEMAVLTLSVHDGNILKLFQFCSKKRLFRIHTAYMNPSTITEEKKKQNMAEIEDKCNAKKCRHMIFNLIERNGVFYLEVTGDNSHFEEVEREITKIQSRILNTRFNCLNRKVYHVRDSTFMIPEEGYGGSTVVSFTRFEGTEFQAQHYGLAKTCLQIKNAEPNPQWRETSYEDYKKRFFAQLELYRSKQDLAVKGTRHWRFFGEEIFYIIRCGSQYFFNVPETLHNTFETTTLSQIEKTIAHHEELFVLEENANIVKDLRTNGKLSLMQNSAAFMDELEPLSLMPLRDAKARAIKRKKEIDAPGEKEAKRTIAMRNSFYPSWPHDHQKTIEFAAALGFREAPIEEIDYACGISFLWQQRELKMSCDRRGVMLGIRHRNTRWLSATFNHSARNNGNDVRVYLETRADLDDDESVLHDISVIFKGRSVFNEGFCDQLDRWQKDSVEIEELSTKPFIPEMLHCKWKFRSMRILKPVLKFVNDDNDIITMHEVNDGIFNESRKFEWFQRHFEVEFKLNSQRSEEELCKKSFDFALSIFDFTKQQQ